MPLDVPTDLLQTASSGSVGDVVFSRNQHGPYLRARTLPLDPGTARQLVVRAALQDCVTAWKTTLTETERQGWDTFALAVRTRTALGRHTNAGGLGMYIRANVPRIQAASGGLPRVDAAPSLFTAPPFTPLTRVVLNVVDDTLHPFTDPTDAWASEPGAAFLFYASAPQVLTRGFWAGPYQYAGPILGSVPPALSPGTLLLPQLTALGQRVFIHARLTTADGRISEPVRLPADTVPQVAPLPVSGLFTPGTFPFATLDVTFDQRIRREAQDRTNWAVRFGTAVYSTVSVLSTNFNVHLLLQVTGTSAFRKSVRFLPPPNDVNGLLTGLPVVAFTLPIV